MTKPLRARYTLEFKQKAVRLVDNGQSIAAAARTLGVVDQTLLTGSRRKAIRAAMAGRSTEAEVRAILESIARPEGRIKLGSLLAEIGQQAGGFDFESERDKSSTEPMSFE
jgi:transposase-like protein